MVQKLERLRTQTPFPETAPAAYPVFYRTYSRRLESGQRESWSEVCDRTLSGLVELGKLTPAEHDLVSRMQRGLKALPSGRWLWVGGTEWSKQPKNFSGAYNCTSTNVTDWRAFGLMMDLAMMGCGTGAVLEPKYIEQLPIIRNRLTVTLAGGLGQTPAATRREETEVIADVATNRVEIRVGDSRNGWVKSYQGLLELSTDERFSGEVTVVVNLSDVRPAGEKLKGFGGVANPVKLPTLYERCAHILNKALGRQLNSVECCLLIDEAAACVVAGNIRRCLPEDALVHTAKGLVPIKEIAVGDLVQTPLGFRKVLAKFDQGLQDVYEIETNATFPRATLNHRYATLSDAQGRVDWKPLTELTPGDRLLHSTQFLAGGVTRLPEDFTAERPEQSRTAKPLTIPELTPEIAWLIGFTHGDGYIALGRNKYDKPYGRVEWAMGGADQTLLLGLQTKLDAALALFGLAASHSPVKGEDTYKSVCSSIRLAEYFHRYIKQPGQSIEVPAFVLQGTIEIRAAYLAGLMDSDGVANNRPPHLVTTVYRSFIRQVAAVLSSLGIPGRLSTIKPQEENWQVKYNLTMPALKGRYNDLIAPHSVKGELRQGLKMYGFTVPGVLMRETYTYSEMRHMGFEGSRTTDANYERYIAEADVDLDVPVTFKGLGSYDHVQTYDIEVEEAHCFYCEGFLTHNSAGMRQFDSQDELAAAAKENLWQQDAAGNWRIDPERDALRMANHTRVYHEKPSPEEVTAAVRKQFYSGEGAIQWAGEAIARSNADLLNSQEKTATFLRLYRESEAKARDYLKELLLERKQASTEAGFLDVDKEG
jgi:ribonucleotide reductase class II